MLSIIWQALNVSDVSRGATSERHVRNPRIDGRWCDHYTFAMLREDLDKADTAGDGDG